LILQNNFIFYPQKAVFLNAYPQYLVNKKYALMHL